VKIVARYADVWNTAGLYWALDGERATAADALRHTRELGERLDEAAAAGRDPGAIASSVLVGWEWPVATATPWASVEAFREFVGRYLELDFTELICPEPTAAQAAVLEAVAGAVLPALRAGKGN